MTVCPTPRCHADPDGRCDDILVAASTNDARVTAWIVANEGYAHKGIDSFIQPHAAKEFPIAALLRLFLNAYSEAGGLN